MKKPTRQTETSSKKTPIEKKGAVDPTQDWENLEILLHSLSKEQKPNRLKILGEIFRAAVKLAQESPGTLNLKIAATALKELRYSFKLFYPHRFSPKITIFGSARVPQGTELYKLAMNFAKEAVKRDFMIMTGGGPGIMAAGNEGAGERGFGLNIRLPMEQDANKYISTKENLINYKYFFTRKLFLVKEASAFVFFPGGFGTFDEAFEVLTLLQTGKTNLIPVVLLEPKGFGFWEGLLKFIRTTVMKGGFISSTDEHLFKVAHSPAEALDHIQHFYSRYHSMRIVRDQLSIRIKKAFNEKQLKKLSNEFKELAQGRAIVQRGPLDEEANEPEWKELPRLVFPFDRREFGELRRMIDFINDLTV